ncbi:CBASS cGAMP-activated phospholipase [Thermincola ferriacetica]
MGKTVKILSIDGGGIRGIIPALILAEIEQRTGKPICQMFDLIAGTSTGGILALGLTRPDDTGQPAYRAEDLVRLYKTEGPVIFSRSVWHRIRAMGSIVEEKYPADGIECVLDRYFGTARLKDALTEVLVPSYEIERRVPFFFKSRYAKEKPEYDFPMKTVARATSAAPTYFEPVQIITDDGLDYYALIDGGVFANNPALCAYAEAIRMFPGAEDFVLVSLGTGELTRPLSYEEVKGWGLFRWAQPILNVVFDGVSDTIDYQLQQLLPDRNGQKRYYRFQTRLDEGNDDLDDASNTNLRVLQLLAETLIQGQSREIDRLCERLTALKL